ncbi:hypothetical protein C3920_00790 [Novacetimonas pomaceti]|uniref:Uncharacterized protein n=2 Tax=Novacetimonas pomaceti TaxID=2021998 RepID=A0ABX5P5V8_9PROT|nr:hypothetical protein C3920_00790 [Novacetimonas pomaceti]
MVAIAWFRPTPGRATSLRQRPALSSRNRARGGRVHGCIDRRVRRDGAGPVRGGRHGGGVRGVDFGLFNSPELHHSAPRGRPAWGQPECA